MKLFTFKNNHAIALLFAGLSLFLFFTILFSLSVGRYPLKINDLICYLVSGKSHDPMLSTVLINIRLPRIVGALLVGSALSVAGTAYQGLFRNPMVSPDILGVSSGAGFGAACAIMCSMGVFGIQLMAFAGGIGAVGLALMFSRILGRNHDRILMLVLSGMVTAAIFNALVSLMKYMADTDSKLPDITFWLMGSLSRVTLDELKVVFPVVLAGSLPIFMLGWKLNILSCGEDEAKALGVNTTRVRLIVIACASMITASVVCVVGLVGWIGLIVPHFARFMVGPDHKVLLPASFLCGTIFILWIDTIARSACALEIPIGILISLIGAPLFLIFLKRSARKTW